MTKQQRLHETLKKHLLALEEIGILPDKLKYKQAIKLKYFRSANNKILQDLIAFSKVQQNDIILKAINIAKQLKYDLSEFVPQNNSSQAKTINMLIQQLENMITKEVILIHPKNESNFSRYSRMRTNEVKKGSKIATIIISFFAGIGLIRHTFQPKQALEPVPIVRTEPLSQDLGAGNPATSQVAAHSVNPPAKTQFKIDETVQIPECNMGGYRKKIVKIIVHITDSEGDSAKNTFMNPINKKSSHYIIYKDGRVLQPVPDNRVAYHCKGENLYSIGIELVGILHDTNKVTMTKAQFNKLITLIKFLELKYNLTGTDVYGHREFDNKECPGLANLKLIKKALGIQITFKDAYKHASNPEWRYVTDKFDLNTAAKIVMNYEAFHDTSYPDQNGFTTVGYGFNMDRNNAKETFQEILPNRDFNKIYKKEETISKAEAIALLRHDLYGAIKRSREWVLSFDSLPAPAQYIVFDMTFTMGSLRNFPNFRKALSINDFRRAAIEMQYKTKREETPSEWYQQTGRRAEDLVNIMKALAANYEP